MSEKEALRRRIGAYRFAAWELHLFLDSHPENAAAAARLAGTRTKAEELIARYEEKYGPYIESARTAGRWAWIADPWPWDIEEE